MSGRAAKGREKQSRTNDAELNRDREDAFAAGLEAGIAATTPVGKEALDREIDELRALQVACMKLLGDEYQVLARALGAALVVLDDAGEIEARDTLRAVLHGSAGRLHAMASGPPKSEQH